MKDEENNKLDQILGLLDHLEQRAKPLRVEQSTLIQKEIGRLTKNEKEFEKELKELREQVIVLRERVYMGAFALTLVINGIFFGIKLLVERST